MNEAPGIPPGNLRIMHGDGSTLPSGCLGSGQAVADARRPKRSAWFSTMATSRNKTFARRGFGLSSFPFLVG
jgi:hypothetical protein